MTGSVEDDTVSDSQSIRNKLNDLTLNSEF